MGGEGDDSGDGALEDVEALFEVAENMLRLATLRGCTVADGSPECRRIRALVRLSLLKASRVLQCRARLAKERCN